jgi:hypothetical protein
MATLLTVLLYVTSGIGSIATIASAASKFIDPESDLGKWVAWIASCPVGHSPKALAAKESK